MAEHKNSKLLMEDSILYTKRLVDNNQFSISKELPGKVKNSIKRPGTAMIDAVTRLIYYFEKES